MDENIYMNCACHKPVRFIISASQVTDYSQSAYLEVQHDGRFVWSGRVGGRDWYEKSDNNMVAYRLLTRIRESMEYEIGFNSACIAMFANGAAVLKELLDAEEENSW